MESKKRAEESKKRAEELKQRILRALASAETDIFLADYLDLLKALRLEMAKKTRRFTTGLKKR